MRISIPKISLENKTFSSIHDKEEIKNASLVLNAICVAFTVMLEVIIILNKYLLLLLLYESDLENVYKDSDIKRDKSSCKCEFSAFILQLIPV